MNNTSPSAEVHRRALLSAGTSSLPIYRAVTEVLATHDCAGGLLVDVGCGAGNLYTHVRDRVRDYVGVDVVRHDGFPSELAFVQTDLDTQRVPLSDGEADVVAAVETIEHVENPRAFLRELVRLLRPGGWVVVTTPNQLSLLSKLTLVFKNQFNAFQDGCYPAHLTALLEADLRRMAAECLLADVSIRYSHNGRIPGTPWHYPAFLSRWLPRALSDNVVLMGKKPQG